MTCPFGRCPLPVRVSVRTRSSDVSGGGAREGGPTGSRQGRRSPQEIEMNMLKNGIRPRALRLVAGMLALGAAATVMAAAPATARRRGRTTSWCASRTSTSTRASSSRRAAASTSTRSRPRTCPATSPSRARCAATTHARRRRPGVLCRQPRRRRRVRGRRPAPIRSGSSPDKSATFAERVYISPDAYRGAGGSGTWAVRALDLGVTIRTLDSSRLFLWGYDTKAVETFRAY